MARPLGFFLAAPLCFVSSTEQMGLRAPAAGVGPDALRGTLSHPAETELSPGERLIRVLKDSDQPLEERAAAARELGRLKYLPAIPVLLYHIALPYPPPKLRDTIEWTEDPFDDLDRQGPCIDALKRYGRKAVLPTVRQYISPSAIWERDHIRTVLRYASRDGSQVREAIRVIRSTVTDIQQTRLLAELCVWAGGKAADFERLSGPER
jgi:hypothetical protein